MKQVYKEALTVSSIINYTSLLLQVEKLFFMQPFFWYPRHCYYDLHVIYPQQRKAIGTGYKHYPWTIHHEPHLLYSLFSGPGMCWDVQCFLEQVALFSF